MNGNDQQQLGKTLWAIADQLRGEQHRIADCLSSLDEVIASQSRKLDGLKPHKKGLMQQLFPSREVT